MHHLEENKTGMGISAAGAPSLRQFLSLQYSFGGHPATRVFSQRLGAGLAWLASHLGMSPNGVTAAALLVSLLGATAYATLGDSSASIVICVVLMQLGYALDCADGQLARATGRTSAFGAWWDVYCDYLAVLALSFAILSVLLRAPDLRVETVLALVLLFTFGRVSSLYSSTMARVWRNKTEQAAARHKSIWRESATVMIDTPVTLLAVCLLRVDTQLLSGYLVLAALVYLMHGIYVGRGAAKASV